MDNIMEEFVKTIKEISLVHPARTLEFLELTQGLFAEVAKGNVNVNYHPEFPQLALFKYSQKCVMEKNWNKFTLMARGLILDLQEKKVISTPFIKFFNYNEIFEATQALEPEYDVFNKYDGSLGIMYNYADKFRFATSGSFISGQAVWAEKWMNEHMPLDKIDKTNTYLFEIIYAENKIVVYYDFEGLVLLSIFDSYGLEYNYEQIKREASYMETRYASRYDFEDMNSILKNVKTLDRNSEGYVIRFKSGVRLKIKGDEYVRIHRLISKVTPLAIWDMILHGDNIEAVKKELPEELEKDFNVIKSILYGELDAFSKEVESLYEMTKSLPDKELGLYIQSNPYELQDRTFEQSLKYVFLMRKGKYYDYLNDLTSTTRGKIFGAFRPKSNILEGYTPSSAINRFDEIDN